jgi:hypothetical protein
MDGQAFATSRERVRIPNGWCGTTRSNFRSSFVVSRIPSRHTRQSWRTGMETCALHRLHCRHAWDHHIAAEKGDLEQGIPRLTPNAPEGRHSEHTTLHDHRRSYAVNSRKRGMPDPLIAHQAGHANTLLIAKRYGRYTPNARDFAVWVGPRRGKRKKRRLSYLDALLVLLASVRQAGNYVVDTELEAPETGLEPVTRGLTVRCSTN